MKTFLLTVSTTVLFISIATFTGASPVQAHRSGCHRWHSCPSDTGSYVCGDLGYACQYGTYSSRSSNVVVSTPVSTAPTPAITEYNSGTGVITYTYNNPTDTLASTETNVLIPSDQAVFVVEKIFSQIYGRKIMPSESWYWKFRARNDKKTVSELKGAMSFHKSKGTSH